jgi:hypothetical protein
MRTSKFEMALGEKSIVPTSFPLFVTIIKRHSKLIGFIINLLKKHTHLFIYLFDDFGHS